MAPSKRAKRAAEDTLNNPNDLEPKATTPFGMGLAFIRTATTSLTTSFGTSLPFLSEFATKNLKLFDEINWNQDTLDQMTVSTVPPRSMRFKFELKTIADVAKTDKFKELADSVKAPIAECQRALKDSVLASTKLKIDHLKKQKMEQCLKFLCFLAQAYIISKPEYKNVKAIRAVDGAVDHVSIASLFETLTEEESRIIMCSFFNDDIDTAFTGDNDVVTIALSNLLVVDAHRLFVVPQTKYDDQAHQVTAIKKLHALSTSAVKGPITETTATAMDTEITIPSKDLETFIDQKINEKTKELQTAVKNLSQGASSSASSNKKSDPSNTKPGKPSGGKRQNNKSTNNQTGLKPLLKPSPRYTSQEKVNGSADDNNNASNKGKSVKWISKSRKNNKNVKNKSNVHSKRLKKK